MSLKNPLVFLALFCSLFLGAQHRITGDFSPAADFKWAIAYKVAPTTQNYIADAEVKNGKMDLQIPANAPTGTYRIVYGVPQEEFYFDVLYNGTEDIALSFDRKKGLTFTASQENILLNTYFSEIKAIEADIEKFYEGDASDQAQETALFQKLEKIQETYASRSKNGLNGHFIRANKPYIPTAYEREHAPYLYHKMEHYFDVLDFNDPVLQGSAFLADKLTDYVFRLFPIPPQNRGEMEHEMQRKLQTVAQALKNVELPYQTRLLEGIWETAVRYGFEATTDFLYENHLRDLAQETQNLELIDKIESHNRLRLGATAPEITWEVGETTKSLSALSGSNYYVLVFWSSTCSHCLNELPQLQQDLKGISGVTVLAIGLEDQQSNWLQESAKLPGFTHALALGKWDNRYVELYKIQHTPTYYILDGEKRIVAKPGHFGEVADFLKR